MSGFILLFILFFIQGPQQSPRRDDFGYQLSDSQEPDYRVSIVSRVEMQTQYWSLAHPLVKLSGASSVRNPKGRLSCVLTEHALRVKLYGRNLYNWFYHQLFRGMRSVNLGLAIHICDLNADLGMLNWLEQRLRRSPGGGVKGMVSSIVEFNLAILIIFICWGKYCA